jgi:uncharacterized cupin superfamily protein
MTHKIEIEAAPLLKGARYPMPYDEPCAARERRRLGDAAGLSQFGVNLLRLPPGAWSSQRHWHSAEDEFTWVVEGEVVLVTDAGEEILRAGDCAGFKAGEADGHHFQNRSDRDVIMLEVGTRSGGESGCDYPDIDMVFPPHGKGFQHRDGRPYATEDYRG